VAVDVKTAPTLPFSAPRAHSPPVWSRKLAMPSANELEGARFQGRLVAETARKLHG